MKRLTETEMFELYFQHVSLQDTMQAIQDAVLERAALVAESVNKYDIACENCADAIRAMKETK